MRLPFFIALLLCQLNSSAQYFFSEKFTDCSFGTFCRDCGDVKAAYNGNLESYFSEIFTAKNLVGIEGQAYVQVYIDSNGKQCVMSMYKRAIGKVDKLKIPVVINQMKGWKPASTSGKPENASITIRFDFTRQTVKAAYQRFDPSEATNMRSVGRAEILNKKSTKKTIPDKMEKYTQRSSPIPWDMSRAIVVDSNNIVWLGTDNGIVKIENGRFSVLNSTNSALKIKGKQVTIMNATVDSHNNKWFSDNNGTAYKYDDKQWTVFDSSNSPLKWISGIYADKVGNVWFSSNGLVKYDGKDWSVMDTANTLGSKRILGVFVDSKKRLWVGTDSGNVVINSSGYDLKNDVTPLKHASISKGYEDAAGNIWFQLYQKYPAKIGFAKLSASGEWSVINTENSKIPANDILDFTVDEKKNIFWFSINKVGMAKFDGNNWFVSTPDDTEVPSTYIQSIALDKQGNVWAATFAGLLKIISE